MHPFPVYPLYDIQPTRARGSYLWDQRGDRYLDLYGGHAVISVGHSHPTYVARLTAQLQQIGFYSNSVRIPQQEELAQKLGEASGYPDYSLFLCNSGAEANENALKLASFHTGRKKVITFTKSFHGRTGGAVVVTDNPAIIAPYNQTPNVHFVPFNDPNALAAAMTSEVAAVIVEGIQGVGGIHVATDAFLQAARRLCDQHGAALILDSVQCGYGRSGRFFSHQFAGIHPDLMTVAKGMGNGFPVGGVLIHPRFRASHGLLGTTFGGNHLACVAATAVLDIMREENLVENAATLGEAWLAELRQLPGVREVRGRGLMIGLELEQPADAVRKKLLFGHRIFTGASGTHTIRLLPSLAVSRAETDVFTDALATVLAAGVVAQQG